ncbi:MAG: DEAD/DEAH box helicase family protein [Spirochaetales bacterium]|nr:DEAD/DEAH box helicase family protein [Spirochaetales bacterium]
MAKSKPKRKSTTKPTTDDSSSEEFKLEERGGAVADPRFSSRAREKIQEEIDLAGGREVLFICFSDEDGLIYRVFPLARGDHSQVPASMIQILRGRFADPDLEPNPSDARIIVHNHPSGVLFPSKADLEVASILAQEGIGTWIVDNQVQRVFIVNEAYHEPEAEELDDEELGKILEPGGALDRLSDNFEPRPTQVQMLRAVASAFNTNKILVCEAGTGVGKSFAYLVPAIRWASQNQERVVVSTATINLQHQLIEKDIPMVQKMLGTKLKAVLAKGRNNYLCLNRLEDVLEEDSLFREEDDALTRIAQWAETTKSGERSDLSFYAPDSLWGRINSDPDSCSPARCRARESCFLLKARREASQAGLIVANHHLFFADAAMRAQGLGYESTVILPGFTRVIFDEAHTIENAATSYFSRSLNRFSVYKYMNMLLRRKGGKSLGIVQVMRSFVGLQLPDAESLIDQIKSTVQDTEKAILEFLGTSQNLRLHPAQAEGENRLSDSYGQMNQELFHPLAALQSALLGLVDHLAQELKTLKDEDLEIPQVSDLRIIIRRLEDSAGLCQDFRQYHEQPDLVFWIDKSRVPSTGDMFVTLTATPLDITTMMRDTVFEPYETVVLTSATMAVQGRFDFFERRVGLTGFAPLRGTFQSPFDYSSRVLLAAPADAPDPTSAGYPDYLIRVVSQAVTISQGRALILFTSYALLNQVFDGVRPVLEQAGIPVYRQGDDDKTRLLRTFRDDVASVLFATDSFWEGVDTPGSSLELLILSRLPFKVPTDPVVKARAEAIEARGGSSFMEMSVPEAIMKFKQGFGRLMRRSDDRGVVLVTDVRLIQKQYGRLFLGSLPETRRVFGTTDDVLSGIQRFFDTVV